MKILVIQQKMIGDVLLSSILCNNLKKAYPAARIDYMVYESTTAVLEGNPNIDKIVLFENKHRSSSIQLIKLAWEIRREKYDIIIDAYSKLESWIFVLLSGAKRRISYEKPGRKFLYTDNIPVISFPRTNMGLAIERRLSLLKPLHLPIEIEPFPKLSVTEEETEFAQAIFKKNGVRADRKTIMISLIGSDESKTYPLDYMTKLVNHIGTNYDVNILFNYFPKQIEQAKTIFNQCSTSVQEKIYFDLLGDNLRTFIAIMNQCDMIIGNDGGAINLAKALNKPAFIIFSPWIEKKIWSTFEDGKTQVSVHLKDYISEPFESLNEKQLKEKTPELYQKFVPELFLGQLTNFLDNNLPNTIGLNSLRINQIRLPISALIITYNEEKHIEEVLKDIDFADEIVVVDSYSTDRTLALVNASPKAKLFQRTFDDYSSQRNFAIECARNPWILFIDADERFTEELKEEVIETIQQPDTAAAYLFYRIFMFENTKLNYSGWQTDKIFRLFKKDKAKYVTERLVHEKLKVNGKVGKLKHKLIHYSYTDYESYKNKMVSYGKLKAKEEFAKKIRPNFYHFYLHPAYKFLYQFIVRLGFLDGRKGITICYLNALSVYVRYRELAVLNKRK